MRLNLAPGGGLPTSLVKDCLPGALIQPHVSSTLFAFFQGYKFLTAREMHHSNSPMERRMYAGRIGYAMPRADSAVAAGESKWTAAR